MKKRIENLIKELGITKAKFADIIGVSAGVVTQWTNGRQNVNEENLKKIIENFPRINKDWLYYGNGTMFNNENKLKQDLFSNSKNDFNNNLKQNNTLNYSGSTQDSNINTDSSLQNFASSEFLKKKNKSVEKIVFIFKDKTFEIFENSD